MKTARRLLQTIQLANRHYGFLEPGDSILVAVSGGADSAALLCLLSKLRARYRLRLVVAHLNHGWIPLKSARYQSFVSNLSARLGLPFYTHSIDIHALSRDQKRSLEETGRIERYRFFRKIALKTRCRKIATAHTLDDQAETLLMRIFRGSGSRGLVGIPFKRNEGHAELIRPLLLCEKRDLISFLREEKVRFCADPTNRSRRFTRSRLRHELLPKIERWFNPQVKRSLANLQAIMSQTRDYLDRQVEKSFKGSLLTHKSSRAHLLLKIPTLRKLHPAILAEVIQRAILESRGDLKRFDSDHFLAISEMIRSPRKQMQLHLPGLVIRKLHDRLDFGTKIARRPYV